MSMRILKTKRIVRGVMMSRKLHNGLVIAQHYSQTQTKKKKFVNFYRKKKTGNW